MSVKVARFITWEIVAITNTYIRVLFKIDHENGVDDGPHLIQSLLTFSSNIKPATNSITEDDISNMNSKSIITS